MYFFLKNNIFQQNCLNFLIAFIPVSFIAGNLIINLNIILLILLTILFNRNLFFNLKYHILDKLIFIYFILLFIAGFFTDYYFYANELNWRSPLATTIKTFFFLKYILFYLILRYLIEKNLVSLKFFFISCLITSLFVSLDIFYQLLYGKDIFGYEQITGIRKLAGPFGDEYIAGSFIQRFSIFSFFLIPIFFTKFNQKYLKCIIPLIFIIFFLGITFSGNRMPLILFLLSIVLIFLFQKNIRKYLIYFLVIFPIIFFIIFNFNTQVKNNFNNLFEQVRVMKLILLNDKTSEDTGHSYIKEFKSFYDTWLINKYIGGGIKNFRYFCHQIPEEKKQSNFTCNMHPHNYYLEILTESGVIGFIIILLIFSLIIYLSLIKKYFTQSNLKNINIIIPFIFLFIVEIFPIKSTGSFFTTGNTTYLFFLIAVLIGLSRREKIIEK